MRPFQKSWTPVDPRYYGAARYRVVAGLPDRKTLGNCLIFGSLRTLVGVSVVTASDVAPPDSYGVYHATLIEYSIENARSVVANTRVVTLEPPYGGDPLHPPFPVPACPKVVA